MPNAKVLSEKQAIVEALVERINAASAGILVDYKAAFMEGKILSEQEIAELSTLTSKNDLYSKLAGSLNAIMGGLAVALSEVVEQKGGAAAPAEAAE